MPERQLKRPFVPSDVIREVWPKATDDECDFLLWEFTGWPSFWHTDYPDDEIRECMRKLKRTMFWRRVFLIRTYPDSVEYQMGWRWILRRKFWGRMRRLGIIDYEGFHKRIWGER